MCVALTGCKTRTWTATAAWMGTKSKTRAIKPKKQRTRRHSCPESKEKDFGIWIRSSCELSLIMLWEYINIKQSKW